MRVCERGSGYIYIYIYKFRACVSLFRERESIMDARRLDVRDLRGRNFRLSRVYNERRYVLMMKQRYRSGSY